MLLAKFAVGQCRCPDYHFLQIMNSLKKALARDDPKKYNKTKIQISDVKRSQTHKDIEWMFLKKVQKPLSELKIQECFKQVVENNFANGELTDASKMYQELTDKYAEVYPNEPSSDLPLNVLSVLRNMAKAEAGLILKKYLEVACQKMQQYAKQKQARQKEKCLDDFNKLLKKMKPNAFQKQEISSVNKALKKLVHSTSATNLKIRVTRDEYQLEQEENPLRKKKSLDVKNKSKVSSSSHKNLSGSNKLQMFLKDTNVKLVKTKIQYDFSAIFEASRSNIQQRNKTTYVEPKNQKQLLTKATKGKRDEAFVFYRPKKKH